MGPLPQLFPFPPNTTRSPLYRLSTADDKTNQSPSTSQCNSKRTQLQSHSPLRTLLRLSPRQESPDRCHDLVRVRYRAAITTLHPA